MEQTAFIQLLQSINFVFIAIVCLITYGIIQLSNTLIKKEIPRTAKSIISLIIGIIVAIIYIKFMDVSLESILLSFLICTFGYDIILKPLFKSIIKKFTTEDK